MFMTPSFVLSVISMIRTKFIHFKDERDGIRNNPEHPFTRKTIEFMVYSLLFSFTIFVAIAYLVIYFLA